MVAEKSRGLRTKDCSIRIQRTNAQKIQRGKVMNGLVKEIYTYMLTRNNTPGVAGGCRSLFIAQIGLIALKESYNGQNSKRDILQLSK